MKIYVLAMTLLLSNMSTQAANRYTAQDIESGVRDYLSSTGLGDNVTQETEIDIIRIPSHLSLSECENAIEYLTEQQRSAQNHLTVKVSCNAPKWSIRVPISLATFKSILVSSKNLSRGEILTRDSVSLQRYNVRMIHESYFESPEDVDSFVLSRSIKQGTVLTQSMIKKPMFVRRGDIVRIFAKSEGLLIESSGIAMMDGVKDQIIKVKNGKSQIVIDAKVDSQGTVVVIL